MDQISSVLCVNGRIPRRAVLLGDGGLGDKVQHPAVAEVDLLSRLCEVARASGGQAVYPRRTTDLLEQALSTNHPGAWEAARDDLVTGDLDLDGAAAVVRYGSNSAALIACLVGARDGKHMMSVATVVGRVVDRLCEDSRAEVGRALACQLRAVMDAFVVHGALMSRDVRDAVLGGFGRIMATAGVPDARVAELVLYALSQRRDELLRLFLHVPTTFLAHRPQILAELLDRAKTAPAQARYPAVALLARIVAADPGVISGFEREVSDVVCGVLPHPTCTDLDSRMCLAAAVLTSAAGGCGNALCAALAKALQSCSAHLVETQNFSL